MTVNYYNRRTKEYYVGLGIHSDIFVDTNYNRNHKLRKRVATLMKCLDIITLKIMHFNIKEMDEVIDTPIKVNKGAFLRRKKEHNLSKRVIYRISPKRVKKTKKEKSLGI